jgi:hypothetical protein
MPHHLTFPSKYASKDDSHTVAQALLLHSARSFKIIMTTMAFGTNNSNCGRKNVLQ